MRSIALLLLAALTARAPAADPPKVDLKKGIPFAGRAEATVVEIRPRVTGYIERVLVKEGDTVRKGDVLAEIGDRPYRAKLDVAKAQLAVAKAQSNLATANLERAKAGFAKGAVSKDELIQTEAANEEATARVEVAKAMLQMAELDMAFTKLRSPIDGKVGRLTTTPGNLLVADGPSIVTVVADKTITVAFDVDEGTFLAMSRAMLDNGGKPAVEVALSDEDGYPRKASVVTNSSAVDPATGTIRFHAKLDNPKGLIVHGMYLRVRLTVQPEK